MYKYRESELPRFCRVRRYSRLMKTWNIWLWWRGFSDLCRTICLRGQSMFRTNVVWTSMLWGLVGVLCLLILVCSRHSDKYIRKGRLNWPEGCTSRESMKAVMKLSRLQVCLSNAWQNIHLVSTWNLCRCCLCSWQNLVMQNVDQAAGDLIDLLQVLLKYDPADRLTAQEALRHPFFTEGFGRRWYSLQLSSPKGFGEDKIFLAADLVCLTWWSLYLTVRTFLSFFFNWSVVYVQ